MPPKSTVRTVKFNQLPATVRLRLVQILEKGGDPTLVRFDPGSRDGWIAAAFFAIAGAIATVVTALWLFDEDSRKDAWFDREIYALMAGFAFLSMAGIASLVVRKLFPPPPFPMNARLVTGGYIAYVGRDVVTIGTLGDEQPTITNVYRNGVYQHARLDFALYNALLTLYCGNQQDAEAMINKVYKAKQVFRELRDQKDAQALAELDPFAACTLSGVWEAPSDVGPKVAAPPTTVRLAQWSCALAAALVVTGAYFSFMKARCKTIPGCHTLSGGRGF